MSVSRRKLDDLFEHNKEFYQDDLTSCAASHIRLLSIVPGNLSDTVSCELESVPLTPDLVYGALSYAWGNQPHWHSITLNGQPSFRVTDGVFGAIRRLRHGTECTRVWIDAICINQANIGERSAQVAMMADIFSLAELVYVWLGPCGDGTPPLFETEDCAWHAVGPDGKIALKSDTGTRLEPLRVTQDGSQAQWWWRTWVVQEFALARRIEVLIGPHRTSWTSAMQAFKDSYTEDIRRGIAGPPLLYSDADSADNGDLHRGMFERPLYSDSLSTFTTHYQLEKFDHLRRERASIACSLRNLLELTSSLEASGPRDKVYGILGLLDVSYKAAWNVAPAYNKSSEEVFSDATLHLIQSEQSLDIVVEHWHRCCSPSWALDFGQSHRDFPPPLLDKRPFDYAQTPQDRRSISKF